jgi:hypothetical protein
MAIEIRGRSVIGRPPESDLHQLARHCGLNRLNGSLFSIRRNRATSVSGMVVVR